MKNEIDTPLIRDLNLKIGMNQTHSFLYIWEFEGPNILIAGLGNTIIQKLLIRPHDGEFLPLKTLYDASYDDVVDIDEDKLICING